MATDLNIQIKINNQMFSSLDSPIKIKAGRPIITWDFDEITVVDVDETDGTFELETLGGQLSVEISIADNNTGLGSASFKGNMAFVEMTSWKSKSWQYLGTPLERGGIYYGQIRVIDFANRTSQYKSFAFSINSLPEVSDVTLSPISPSVSNNLTLAYDYVDPDGDIEGNSLIRWFKNGIYQRNLDGQLTVDSSYMQIGDVWYVDVLPYDGLEFGKRVSSNLSQVIKTPVSIVSAKISPSNPNENDILKADYQTDIFTEDEDFTIRWFVNDILQEDFRDSEHIRYNTSVGDIVRYEISNESGTSFITSESVTILPSDYLVYDIKIDGSIEPLDVSSVSPNISWKTFKPSSNGVKYTRIQIGTFFEASNVYEEIFESDKDNFTVPANILNRGMDYYVSISVSDTTNFNRVTSSHFRIRGSRWSNSVNNQTGWTIEAVYLIQDSGDFDELQYQVFRISDGTFYGEVRLYNNRVTFVSEETLYTDIDSDGSNLLTIVGQGNDIKIYLNRTLVLDATGKFTQPTSDKILEVGNITGQSFSLTYKNISYTTSGHYTPGDDPEYAKMQFATFLLFEENEIVALKGYTETIDDLLVNTKVFASNPDDISESGKVFSILSADPYRTPTVSKTYSPINKIRSSPDGKKTVFGHAKGFTVINGYLINPFNFEIDFTQQNASGEYPLPNQNGWELIQDMGWVASYFDNDGFNIDTINPQ